MARSRACPSSSSPNGVSRIIGACAQARLGEQAPERFDAQAALAEVGVAVLVRPQRSDRIVEVDTADEVESEMSVELGQEVVPAGSAVDGVAGGKGMTGVEADAQTIPARGARPDRGQLLEPAPQHRPLPGRDLEQHPGGAVAELGVHGIERPGDGRQTASSTPVPRCAPGCTTSAGTPSAAQRRSSSARAARDFARICGSGAARLMR